MDKKYEDILKGIEPERIEIIERCITEIQGKNEMEILSIITKAMKEFTDSGRNISPEEKKSLIYAMRDSLETEKKKKFDIILNMLGIKL